MTVFSGARGKDSQATAVEQLESYGVVLHRLELAQEKISRRLDDIERELQRTSLDWSELYDKCQKALGRFAARQRRDRQDSHGDADAPAPQGPPSAEDLNRLILDGKLDVHNLDSAGVRR